jgi:opacity protein-like surface antigen
VIPEDPTADLHGSFFPGSPAKFHENVGAGAGVSLGYQGLFLPGIRAEGEIVYRTNNVDRATSSGFPGTTGARGTIDSAGFMGNVLYDFMSDSQWTPYLGAGVGAARVTVNDISFPAFSSQTFSGNDWRFAYQGIAGVKYAFTPAVSVSLDYRYFATTDAHYTFPSSGFVTSATVPYHTHNVMLGLAYHFLPPPPPPPPVAAAPPPPPAPAPPPPARQFVVYFEFEQVGPNAGRGEGRAGCGSGLQTDGICADRRDRLHGPGGHAAVQPRPLQAARGHGACGAGAAGCA